MCAPPDDIMNPKRRRWVVRRPWYFLNKESLVVVIAAMVENKLPERNFGVHKKPLLHTRVYFYVHGLFA